jgi:alkyl hydroperoxide reductase subunit AhpC
MVAFEVERARFEAANAQVLGINVDHVWSHAAWGESMGGLGYPLLADFNLHGEVTRRYGLWRSERGNGKRAIFVIDKEGIVRWVKVYERGIPENEELLTALAALA